MHRIGTASQSNLTYRFITVPAARRNSFFRVPRYRSVHKCCDSCETRLGWFVGLYSKQVCTRKRTARYVRGKAIAKSGSELEQLASGPHISEKLISRPPEKRISRGNCCRSLPAWKQCLTPRLGKSRPLPRSESAATTLGDAKRKKIMADHVGKRQVE